LLSLRGAATDEARPAHETRAQTERFAASDRIVSRSVVHAQDAKALDESSEPAFEPDAPELLQRSPTFDQVLGVVNADIGPDGEPVDRDALAAVLGSDPELARLLDESEF
jgi:hypothetical protein